MADSFNATLDTSEWNGVFAALEGPVRESLARRMAVEGGVLLRDSAKANVALSDGPYNPNSRGSQAAGTLQDAIYLAYDTDLSNGTQFTYKITWNAKKAWWGKLEEFGYFRKYLVYYNDKLGHYVTVKDTPLADPVWVAAKPFLRPAYDVNIGRLASVMFARGRKELPILLAEVNP